jgi:hypothetical protein
MGKGICVGAMDADTGRAVRLLPPGKICHPPEVSYQVGEFWQVAATPRTVVDPPHVEDHDEASPRRIGTCRDLAAGVRRFHKPWEGEPAALFDGVLKWRKTGTGYVARTKLPASSVGFWTPPRPLVMMMTDGHPHYVMFGHGTHFKIPLVGVVEPVRLIPEGTLLRVSLARWWVNPQTPAEGETCSLQLSGWLSEITASPPAPGLPRLDDLPF